MAITPYTLLISLIFSLTVSAQQGFLSIDSGALQPYVDPATEIQWVTDGTYINSGSNTMVSGTNISHELTTLKYFPALNANNCYVLPVGKNVNYFFNAFFYYGNYDGVNYMPTFNLTFDGAGGQWFDELFKNGVNANPDTVHFVSLVFPSNESSSVSLCLSSNDVEANVPFISALTLRTLPTGFYTQVAGAVFLHLTYRVSFGASSDGWLGYPDDKYDRRWYLDIGPLPNAIARTTNLTITTDNMPNQPPSKVMMTAFEALNVSTFNYTLSLGTLSSKLAVYLYFMELNTRVATDVRMFTVYIQLNDEVQNIDVNLIEAAYWITVWTTFIGGYNEVLSPATLTISMVPTKNSTLPPIFNAMEVFKYDEPTPATPSPPQSPSSTKPSPPPPPSSSHSDVRPNNSGIGAPINYWLLFLLLICLIA